MYTNQNIDTQETPPCHIAQKVSMCNVGLKLSQPKTGKPKDPELNSHSSLFKYDQRNFRHTLPVHFPLWPRLSLLYHSLLFKHHFYSNVSCSTCTSAYCFSILFVVLLVIFSPCQFPAEPSGGERPSIKKECLSVTYYFCNGFSKDKMM